MYPTIEIIIPAFKAESTILETIKSVECQISPPDFLTAIIRKNGANDPTLKIVKNNIAINLLIQKNVGLYDAMNEGILKSQADYILILNADDLISPNFINHVREEIKNQDFDILFMPVFREGGLRSEFLSNRTWLGYDYAVPGHSASMIVKRNLHKKIGLYNTNIKYSADYDLIMRALRNNLIIRHFGDSRKAFGIFRPAGFSSTASYRYKRLEEFRFRYAGNRRISDIIYCFIIFPLQFMYSFFKG